MDATAIKDKKRLILQDLKNKFKENLEEYRSPLYNETKTRTDFIDKFFEILGWDVSNEEGKAEKYRESWMISRFP